MEFSYVFTVFLACQNTQFEICFQFMYILKINVHKIEVKYTHNVSVWGQNLLSFTEEQVSKNLFTKRVSLAYIYLIWIIIEYLDPWSKLQ